MDGAEWKPVERVETFGQAFQQYASYYMQFNGRLPALLQSLSYNKLGTLGTACISATVYVSTLLLIVRIGLKSWENVVKAPVWLLLSSLYMYELTPTGTYIEMWTFVCQYGVPTLLYLLYYLLVLETYKEDRVTKGKAVWLLILGFLAGACHECLGAFCICLVTVKAIWKVYQKHMNLKRIWLNIGLYLGYMVTFFAPGNFKRLFSSHDEARHMLGVMEKVQTSIYEHMIAAGVLSRREGWLFLVFLVVAVVSCIKYKTSVWVLVKDNLEILITLVSSVFVWAIFAPPVPQYGLQFWKALLIIFLLRGIDIDVFKNCFWNVFAVMILSLWMNINLRWIPDLISVTMERRAQIEDAIDKGEDMVYVKKYPQSTYRYLTLYNYANQNVFNDDCGIKYYGIRIIIDDGQ